MTTSEGRTSRYGRTRVAAMTGVMTLSLATAVAAVAPAGAVNAPHGDRVVRERPVRWTPHVMNGSVNALVQVGNRIVAAGTFTSVSPADTFSDTSDDLTRNRIFAFDATTGEIDRRFNPDLGGPANSLDTDGTSIYVAGRFGSVGGNRGYKRVVKLTPTGAIDTSFRAVPNKAANEVVVRGDRVYVGGAFTRVRHRSTRVDRTALAAFDAGTGAVLSAVDVPFSGIYDPSLGGATTIKRFDVTANGDKLVAVGNFAQVGGQNRPSLAVLDTSGTASVSSWSTDRYGVERSNCANAFDNPMRDVDISPDGSFFVVSTTGAFAGGARRDTLCDTTARWEMASGADPTWINYTGGDTSYGVAITGDVVYVGGHFRWQNNPWQADQAGPGAVPRSGIAALDAVNGLPLSWNPGRTRGVGAQALLATADGLWVGSDTTRFDRNRRGRVAFAPLRGGTTVPSVAPASLPNTLYMAGQGSSGDDLQRREVNGSGAPTTAAQDVDSSSDWSAVRGAFYVNGELYHGTASGTLVRRSFNPSTGAVGAAQPVDLYNDPDDGQLTWPDLGQVTGMFYDTARHRLYYTVSGQSALFYRYFTPESRIVGAQPFTASSSVDFSTARGVTLAGGRVLYGSSSDGALRSVAFTGGAVTGSPTTVSNDGSWGHRGLFVPHG